MFNRNASRTPKQKSEKAVMNIIVRLGGCAFLVYFVVQLLSLPKEEKPDATTATILAVVLLVLSAGVIVMTIIDLLNGLKDGRFKTATYEEADIAEYLAKKEAAAADCTCDDAQQELETPAEDATEQTPENNGSEDLK